MEYKLITLEKAQEGMRYLKHLCAGKLMNLRSCNRDIEAIIRDIAEEQPGILEKKPNQKSRLTLAKLLEISKRDGDALNEIFRNEVK